MNFLEFMTEKALDPSLAGAASIRKTGEGGRKYPSERSQKVRKRMKLSWGKCLLIVTKTERTLVQQRPGLREQPTKERGSSEVKQSYADKVKAERKKAAQARIAARKAGGEVKKDTTSAKSSEKKATELLKKKTTKAVNPNYKPAKASGYTRAERDKIKGKGERMLRGIMKDQETDKYRKATGQNPDAKGRTKILGRVNKRMSS